MNDKLQFDDPYYDRLRNYLNTLREETDRGCTLIVAALLEEMLEEVLRGFLIETPATDSLFKAPYAPLSTLSAKAAASRSLGLIDANEFRDIELIRKIRNEFAHNLKCSFDEPQLRDRANALQVGMGILDALEAGHVSKVTDPRQRFMMVATSLVSALYNRRHHVVKNKAQDVSWPD